MGVAIMLARCFVFLLCLLLPSVVFGQEFFSVMRVTDGDTLVLENGERVRLLGINAPELYPQAEEGAETARQRLQQLVKGKRVALRFSRRQRDRHGRLLAHICRADGVWLQRSLLTKGWVWVYTLGDNAPHYAEALLAYEQQARAVGRGLWRLPAYQRGRFIITAEEARQHIGRFRLVEGKVVAVTKHRDTVYVNFGDDWRQDFTIRIKAKALKRFQADGVEPTTWAAAYLRVRGWIKGLNGALIDASHAQQIEHLSDKTPSEKAKPTPCHNVIDSPK